MDNVAIFWDYENCPIPSSVSGFTVVNNLRTLAQPYGSVRSLKAYLGLTEQSPMSKALPVRSELQSSGVSLVDCPHNGRKDVADKMIIVDMLAHAIDNPAPSTIILITGDRDFAYAISILRLRRYRIILVTLPNAHPSLTAQASVCINWSETILPPNVPFESPNLYERLLPREQQEVTGNDVSTSNNTFKPSPKTDYMHNHQPDSGPNEIPPAARRILHGSSPSFELNRAPATNVQPQPSSTFVQSQPSTARLSQPPPWTVDLLPPFTFKPKGLPFRHPGPQFRDETRNDPILGDEDHIPQSPSPSTSPKPNESPASANEQIFTPPPVHEPDLTRTTVLEMTTSSLTLEENVVHQKPPDVVENKQSAVPLHFEVLVQCLQKYQAKGVYRPLRSAVAYEIGKCGTYKKAGVEKFKQYAEMAQSLGIIILGGSDGNAWICLEPRWKNVKIT